MLKEDHIIELIGILIDQENNKIYLVSELMDGDLKQTMTKLTSDEKIQIAKDIAKGM